MKKSAPSAHKHDADVPTLILPFVSSKFFKTEVIWTIPQKSDCELPALARPFHHPSCPPSLHNPPPQHLSV